MLVPYNMEVMQEGGSMPTTKTKKFTPEIDAALYEELVAVAKRNGQSQRYVLEQALTHYLRNVVPSQHLVRAEVLNAFEQSVDHNRDLLQRLAK
jgi:predicted transcriptional regulator